MKIARLSKWDLKWRQWALELLMKSVTRCSYPTYSKGIDKNEPILAPQKGMLVHLGQELLKHRVRHVAPRSFSLSNSVSSFSPFSHSFSSLTQSHSDALSPRVDSGGEKRRHLTFCVCNKWPRDWQPVFGKILILINLTFKLITNTIF